MRCRIYSHLVSKPSNPDSIRSIRSTLLNIVSLSLDNDPKLIPRSAKSKIRTLSSTSTSGSSSLSSSMVKMKVKHQPQSIGSALSQLSESEVTLRRNASSDSDSPVGQEESSPDEKAKKAYTEEEHEEEEEDSSTPSAKSIPILQPNSHDRNLDVNVGTDGEEDVFGSSPSSIDLHNPLPIFFAPNGDVGEEDNPTLKGMGTDQDDFIIMTPVQAQRISDLAQLAFGVEVSKDVVVAEANVGALARRVAGARGLTAGLGPAPTGSEKDE